MKLLLILIIVTFVGGYLRINYYFNNNNLPLDPDTLTYIELAKSLKKPYETYTREPLYIWILKPLTIFPNIDQNIKIYSTFWSIVFLVVFGSTWVRKLPGWVGVITLGYLSINGFLITNSSRGLRTEWQMIFMTLFLYYCLYEKKWYLLVIWACLCGLLSFNTIPVVITGIGFWSWRHKINWRKTLLLSVLPFTLMIPYLNYNQSKFGDALYFWNLYGTWYRNYEFVEYRNTGCPGCPTVEQYRQNGYSGEQLTTRDYFLKFQGPAKVIKRSIRGLVYLYMHIGVVKHLTGSFTVLWIWILRTCSLAGIFILLRKRSILVIIPAVLTNLSAFFIPIDVDPRLWASTIPFMGIIAATGAVQILNTIYEYIRS
jgi:hypothetical protein